MSFPCTDKKVVELRKLANQYGVPNVHKLRNKRALCDAIAQHEEVDDDDESVGSIEFPTFSFPSVRHATDQFHWQQNAVSSKLNKFDTLNLPEGCAFWHGTNVLFPDGRLPFGMSFYGDIDTAREYAEIRGKRDSHLFARIVSAVNVRPLAIMKINAANIKRLRDRMMSHVDTSAFVPLLDYAFPQSADGKHVTRHSETAHDAALNYGLQIEMPSLNVDGWCAIKMERHRAYEDKLWQDEICFLHDTRMPLLERGPDELFLVPRYPHTLLHFHNGAFCGFIDTRPEKLGVKDASLISINDSIDYKHVPKDVRSIPEIHYAYEHREQLDEAYLSLEPSVLASSSSSKKATKPKPLRNTASRYNAATIDFDAIEAGQQDEPEIVPRKSKSNPLGLPRPHGAKLIDHNDLIGNMRFQ